MTYRDLQEYLSAKKMTAFVTTNDTIFKDNAKALSLKTALNADIGELDATGAARVSAYGRQTDGTADKNVNEIALEDFLRKIVADAKVIKKAEPGFDNTFKIPSGSFKTQEILDIGRAFINDLTLAVVDKFEEYGASSVTPANIQAKIDAVEAGSVEQTSGMGAGVAATGDTKAIMKRLRASRRTLKNIGENLLEAHGDAGLIAEWDSICKVEKKKPKDDDDGKNNPPPASGSN